MNELTDPTSRLLAVRIRAARKARGWTLADFAAAIEVTPLPVPLSSSMLSRIELGQRPVSVPELHAIADAVGIVPEYLLRRGELCPTCNQELPE